MLLAYLIVSQWIATCALTAGEAAGSGSTVERSPWLACPAAPAELRVDGDPGDWGDLPRLPLQSSDPPARKDISGEVSLCYTVDALYIAGWILDDAFVTDVPEEWWQQDAVEVFLDSDLGGDADTPAFNADDYQIFLMPLNRGRRFGPVQWRGRKHEGHVHLPGLEIEARVVPERGEYFFEARLPFSGLGIDPRQVRELGFNIALNDHDPEDTAQQPERYYLSLNGEQGLFLDARKMCGLRFEGEPPEANWGTWGARRWWIGVAGSLIVLALLGVMGLSARRVHRLVRRRLAWERAGVLILAGLALVLWSLPHAVSWVRRSSARGELQERSAELQHVFEQMQQIEGLGARLQGVADPELAGFLAGQPLWPAPVNRHVLLDLRSEPGGPGTFRSLGPRAGVPFREYGVVLGTRPGGVPMLDVRLPRPERVSHVHLAVAAYLPGARNAGQGAPLEAVFYFADGNIAREDSFTLDDARSEPLGHGGAAWGVADLRGEQRAPGASGLARDVEGLPLRHVDHLVYEVPSLFHEGMNEARLARLTLAPGSGLRGALVWVSGITLERGRQAPEFLPLALGDRDAGGFPMALRDGRPCPGEVRLAAGDSLEVALSSEEGPFLRLDELRAYYRAERAVERDPGTSAVLPLCAMLQIHLVGDPHPVEVPLRAGLEIDDPWLRYGRRHGPALQSFVAGSFETASGTLHYDGLELPLADRLRRPGPYPVERIEWTVPVSAPSALLVAGITAGVQEPLAPLARNPFVEEREGGALVLSEEVRRRLADGAAGHTFALVRKGTLRHVGPGIGQGLTERLRGTRIESDPEDPVPGLEEWGGREFVTARLPVELGATPRELVLLRELPDRAVLRQRRDLAAVVLGLLALPFLLLLLVELLTRVTRIRPRLTLLFVLTSALPLVALFLVLVNLVLSEQQRAERQRVGEILSAAGAQVQRLPERARQRAREIVATLEPLEGDGLEVVEPELQRLLRDSELLDGALPVEVMVELLPDGSGKGRRFFSNPERALALRGEAEAAGLSLSWGEVIFSGEARSRSGALRVQVSGVAGAEALAACGVNLGDGEALALVAPLLRWREEEVEGGETLAGAWLGRRFPRREAAEVARVLDRGERVVDRQETGSGSRSYRLLRRADGQSVAVLAASVPSRPPQVDLGFASPDLLWFVLLLGAVMVAASLFLGSLVTEGITRPLDRLQRGSRALIEDRDEAVVVPAVGDDEVAELTRSFNHMSADLRRRIHDQELLSAASSCLTQTLDLQERVRVALDFLEEIVGGRALSCYLYDAARDVLRLEGHRSSRSGVPAPASEVRAPRGLLREALRDPAPLWVPAPEAHPSWERSTPTERDVLPRGEPVLLLPMGRAQRFTGVLVIRCRSDEEPLASTDSTFLRNLLAQIAVALENARLYRVALEDPETGLFVHGFLAGRAREAIDRAAEEGGAVALILVRLEPVGSGGRAAGRRSLQEVARALSQLVQGHEIVARAGPQDLEILVPEGGRERAGALLEAFEAGSGDDGSDWSLRTALAVYPEDGPSLDFLLDGLRERVEHDQGAPTSEDRDWIEHIEERFPALRFRSVAMLPVLRQVRKLTGSDATVLLLGETGTGKEVLARVLHDMGPRRSEPFVAVHCAALPEKLLESELFGHERGAFTGADRRRPGRFEEAQGGTLFLDEVADIPLAVQVKLLRVLQDGRVRRLGGAEELSVDVRLIAATNRPLEQLVRGGQFREDLYYRLKVVLVRIPPLRERPEEIPHLVASFLEESRGRTGGRAIEGVEPAALDLLHGHAWPGNVRELRNVIQRAVVLGSGRLLRREDLDFGSGAGEQAEPAAAQPQGEAELNTRQQEVLRLLAARDRMTSRQYLEYAGVSRRTALRDLTDLMDRGLVIREGRRKAASYRLAGRGSRS